MVDNDDNVYVELDYDNIVLVDPNKVISSDGVVSERLVKHENLVMYANLEASLIPRTRLNFNNQGNFENQKISIATINFLKPGNKSYLTNEYTNSLTGIKIDNTVEKNQTFVSQDNTNIVDSELLLISSINIELKQAGIATVSIEMDDIRGRALFEQGENSPYAAFFNYPYPIFHLTVKGYFGKAITYQLFLRSFNARFDTESGNFKVSLILLPYTFNVLTNIPIRDLFSVPYMYAKQYTVNQTNDSSAQSSSITAGNTTKSDVININTSKGKQKIHEVYSEYKAKGLIDDDFPELTVQELVTRLENIEAYITHTFSDGDLSIITDADNYSNTLDDYKKQVYGYLSESWFGKYIDSSNFYISTNNIKVYTFKKEVFEKSEVKAVEDELKKIIETKNLELKNNPTYGDISNPITYDKIYLKTFSKNDVDVSKSYKQRTGKDPDDTNNSVDYEQFRNDLSAQFNNIIYINGNPVQYWYFFEGENSFDNCITNIKNLLTSKSDEKTNLLSEKLSSRLEDKKEGLGFKPLLINVIAVILASSEAFLRLLSDVHNQAWNVREDPNRRGAILDSNKSVISTDSKDSVQKDGSNLIPVYPWPQFFVQRNGGNDEPFALAYPGDPRYIQQTKGFMYNIWPEIEFVEEFIKARTINTSYTQNLGQSVNSAQVTNRVSINALDFPTDNIIYSNKQTVRFLYEIWERIYLYSNYQRLMRPGTENSISNLVGETEAINIKNSLSQDSPDLIKTLKEFGFNSNNFISTMKNISLGGVGESWQKYIRDIFVTPYIQSEVDNSFSILDKTYITPGVNIVSPEPTQMNKLKDYLSTQNSNTTDITDTIPFSGITDWFKTNLADGKTSSPTDMYNTTKTLLVNDDKKMIANFAPQTSVKETRPITNFNFYSVTKPEPNPTNLKQFYLDRINDNVKNQLPTEGSLFFKTYSGNVLDVQTTSILNTPYFVNSIQQGVNNWLSGNSFPYASSAFLFLQSLPLATLREKYKTYDGTSSLDLDYIFATFKKFGAIHKIPYAWVLKYGSIWYRYKTFVNTGIDILQNVFKDFDYVKNFDPITQNLNKSYNLNINGTTQLVPLETSTTVGSINLTQINLGFYPKLINDFNVFFRGYNLFDGYTDTDIQNKLNTNSGFTLVFNTNSLSSFDKNLSTNQSLRLKTWSCTIQDSRKQKDYVVPSFGSNFNQTLNECFDNNGNVLINIPSNPAVFNGSVRTFWSLPNYGYFDNSNLTIPSPTKYMKKIYSGMSEQESFSIRGIDNDYTNIEEIFSTFEKSILDVMEDEFLKFSKSMYDYEVNQNVNNTMTKVIIDKLPKDVDAKNKNFQALMINLLTINQVKSYSSSDDFNTQVQTSQFSNALNVIQNFLEYDVVLKYGNPSGYDRKLFDSYSTVNQIEDKITFNPYVIGTLPSSTTSSIPLSSFISSNIQAWNNLSLYVGFSDEDGVKYTNTGSTITDFFIDMNIEFTPDSVKILAPIIKIYSTQKKIDPTFNKTKFTAAINQFLLNNKKFSDLVFNSLFTQLQKTLPTITEQPQKPTDRAVQSEQLQYTLWDSFKGLNDRWISGYEFSQKTMLDDFLFLDRASRNIRNKIFIDPYVVRKYLSLNSLSEGATVLGVLGSIITEHNFYVSMQPAFVNFYNVNEVKKNATPQSEPILAFGNNLFGTFLNVDTRESSPKMVCMYTSIGSQHTDTSKNEMNRYNSDSFHFERPSTVPLRETYDSNTNWGQVNKVVGFNVDIGIRNQNIFYHFNVSQDMGKETDESLKNLDYTINQVNGKKGSTQNAGLWDFYKSRSYTSQVRCMGNAMIQPTMYFNLRHVPMFYGPYMITEVKHTISPGSFETTFGGVRQSVFSFDDNINYMQILTKKILTEFAEKLKTKTQTTGTINTINNKSNTTLDNTYEIDISSNCSKYLSGIKSYEKYSPATQSATTLSVSDMVSDIKTYISATGGNDVIARLLSFVTVYLGSYNGSVFNCWNNNYSATFLTFYNDKAELIKWPGESIKYFQSQYLCEITNGISIPFAVFKDKQDMFSLMKTRWGKISIDSTINRNNPESFLQAWFTKWNKSWNKDYFDNYKNNLPDDYSKKLKEVTDALKLAELLGL